MRFLVDTSKKDIDRRMPEFSGWIRGQLITPLTGYSDWGGEYGIDNGAFSGFPFEDWVRKLKRQLPAIDRCLFVVNPDIVGSASRTLELWKRREMFFEDVAEFLPKACLVAQDGIELLEIPWDEFEWIFIGGRDPWKDSRAAQDVVKTAKMLGKSVHVGRVNTAKRFDLFADLGADTCDGSGIAMYDHMLENIVYRKETPTLFDLSESQQVALGIGGAK